MLVVSPWSTGGWVNSEVFDHTSIIRFIEQRFGVHEPNITPWRRAVAGDLTSAFDFKTPNGAVTQLPSTVAYRPPDGERHPDYKPAPPMEQAMPVQEAGTRPARPLPYELLVDARVDGATRAVELTFRNTGRAAAVFHVRASDGEGGPRSYTVGSTDMLSDSFAAKDDGGYDLAVHGPNGFFRAFKGSIWGKAKVEVDAMYAVTRSGGGVVSAGILLTLRNAGADVRQIKVHDGYTQKTETIRVPAGATESKEWNLDESFGWYDLLVGADDESRFARHFAGHVETGRDSVTDPAMGKIQLL
jgi:phospholipase C